MSVARWPVVDGARRNNISAETTVAAAGDDGGVAVLHPYADEDNEALRRRTAKIQKVPPRSSSSSSRRAAVLTTLMTTPAAAALAAASAAVASPPPPTASPALVEWGYAESSNGPLAWGSLKDSDGRLAYPACGCQSCAQSPIDLSSTAASPRRGSLGDNLVRPKKPLVLSVEQKHGTPNFTAVDTSDVDACGAVVADGVTYRFVSLHFHTPAENTVDGVAHPMEMHLVHLAADGSARNDGGKGVKGEGQGDIVRLYVLG